MKILFRTCVLLIAVLVAVHITGCGEDVTQEVDSVAFVSASPDIGTISQRMIPLLSPLTAPLRM